MSFEVLGTIPRPVGAFLELGKDRRACLARAIVMRVGILHIDQDAIDDVWHRGPGARLIAGLAVVSRSAIVRRRCCEHDQTLPGFHLAVAKPAVGANHPGSLPEAESLRKPIHRFRAVFVGDQWDHVGIGRLHHILQLWPITRPPSACTLRRLLSGLRSTRRWLRSPPAPPSAAGGDFWSRGPPPPSLRCGVPEHPSALLPAAPPGHAPWPPGVAGRSS